MQVHCVAGTLLHEVTQGYTTSLKQAAPLRPASAVAVWCRLALALQRTVRACSLACLHRPLHQRRQPARCLICMPVSQAD